MTTSDATPTTKADSWSAEQAPGEFERLRRFVLYHLGGFTLGLVRVNDPLQRDGVVASLADSLAADGARLIRVDLANRNPTDLRQALQTDPVARSYIPRVAPEEQRGSTSFSTAVAIVGMEHLVEAEASSSGRPPFAAALNVERDLLRTALPVPVILFLTDHAMDRLDLAAPDFFDWYSGIFNLRPPSLRALEPAAATPGQASESRGPYASPLSPETLGGRLELLEERRADLERAGPGARLRLAQVLKEMGELYAGLAEFHNRQLAVSYLRQAVEIFHEEKQPAEEAAALEKLGDVCYWINDYTQADHRYEAALSIYREIGARLGEANCIKRLGDVHVQLAEYPLARQRYEAALSIYREIGARLGEANCIKRLGDVHVQLAEYPLARQRYEAALPIYREIGAHLGEANTLTELGRTDLAGQDFAAARDRLEQALRIYLEIGSRHGQTYVAQPLATALLALDETGRAVQVLEEGARLAREIEGQPNIRWIQQLLDQIHSQRPAL